MISQERFPIPKVFPSMNKQNPDWTFGQVGNRAKLNFGGKVTDPDDPQYELIKKLILQKYMGQLFGQR